MPFSAKEDLDLDGFITGMAIDACALHFDAYPTITISITIPDLTASCSSPTGWTSSSRAASASPSPSPNDGCTAQGPISVAGQGAFTSEKVSIVEPSSRSAVASSVPGRSSRTTVEWVFSEYAVKVSVPFS